jgi:PKD repeat protein
VALFTGDRVDGPSPLTVNFDGSGSYDSDGTIEAYSWNFGDGASGTGVTTSHTFTSSTDRTYTVILTVTDDGGKTGSMSGSVVVSGSQNGTTLFFDDFEDGMDPAWQTTYGWQATGGILIHDSGMPARAYLEIGKGWTDYIVDVDLDPRVELVGLILRCQEDLQSYVLFQGTHDWLRCRSYVNGDLRNGSGTIAPGFFEGEHHVHIVVSGSSYKVYINDLLRLSFTDENFSFGMPGLYSYGSASGPDKSWFDNFRVTALP